MTKPAQLLSECLALPEDERIDLAAELLASVDGPADADWEQAWQVEVDRRVAAAEARGELAPEWSDVRKRILAKLSKQFTA